MSKIKAVMIKFTFERNRATDRESVPEAESSAASVDCHFKSDGSV